MKKTIKSLEAQIKDQQATILRIDKSATEERTARYKAEQAQGNLQSEKLELEREVNRLKREVREQEKSLIDASARIEVYEFLARLEHKVEKGSSSDGPLPARVANLQSGRSNWGGDFANAAYYGIDWAKK